MAKVRYLIVIEMVFSDYAKQRIVFYSSKYAYTMGVAPAYDRSACAPPHRTAPAPYLFAHHERTSSEPRANLERTSSEPRANLERTRSVPAVLYFNFFMTGTVHVNVVQWSMFTVCFPPPPSLSLQACPSVSLCSTWTSPAT